MAAPETHAPSPLEAEADFLARSLDREDRRRLGDALAAAARLLGREPTAGEPGLEAIPPLLAALEASAAATGEDPEPQRRAHDSQLERLRGRYQQRRQAFSRVETAVGRLREVTSPPAILEAAPRGLCECSRLTRALLSEVRDGAMVASSAHLEPDPERAPALLATLAEQPIALEHPLLEAEVLRRRRATGVSEAQLHPRVDPHLNEAMGWSSYVVAPLIVHGRVIAVLHADRNPDQLDVLDREVLWRFAVGCAQAYESAALRRSLRREREQLRRFLDRLDARLGELSDAATQLAPRETAGDGGEPQPVRPALPSSAAFEGILTRRETEVLSLMADGLTNRRIADRLVISEGTVKFHVNSILRKLRASNRAEAVSRYLSRSLA